MRGARTLEAGGGAGQEEDGGDDGKRRGAGGEETALGGHGWVAGSGKRKTHPRSQLFHLCVSLVLIL
jgi:hypothetical protein